MSPFPRKLGQNGRRNWLLFAGKWSSMDSDLRSLATIPITPQVSPYGWSFRGPETNSSKFYNRMWSTFINYIPPIRFRSLFLSLSRCRDKVGRKFRKTLFQFYRSKVTHPFIDESSIRTCARIERKSETKRLERKLNGNNDKGIRKENYSSALCYDNQSNLKSVVERKS